MSPFPSYSAAPSGDDPLTPGDAVNVLEEILEAQNQSRFLGLKLNVPDYIVTGIHTKYTDPKDCLYYVLVEFLKQVEPRPTWRAIVAALRSPTVNLPLLAMKVENKHFPDPAATRDAPHESATNTGRYNITVALTKDSFCPYSTEMGPVISSSEASSTPTSGEVALQTCFHCYCTL